MIEATPDILELARTDRRGFIDLARLQAAIADRGLGAVVASSSANVTYTGGSYIDFPPLISFVVTTADGRQGIVMNEADSIYFREYSWIEDIRSYRYAASTVEANRDAVRLLAEMLREFGASELVGVEETHLPALYRDALADEMSNTKLVDATDVFDDVRVIKTPAEVELMSYAALATDKAIHTGFALARPADTEQQLAAAIQGAAMRLGADALDHADVHVGPHATIVHAWPMALRLDPGEVIHVDFGAVFGGYHTDIARNATVGEPSADQERFYRPLFEARDAMLEAIRPGATAGEVYDVGQRTIERGGLVYPWGTLGHSIGLSIHEGFEIVRGSDRVLEENMVLNIEPSHVERGSARYHVEDNVLVTGDGARLLSRFSATERMAEIS
ncbi:MAG TPA: Xaa-Pro peptidase family protein [Thermoleophilaceae bacterium]|nr:Xaa-Pro peptidase family protein [Thermoleophilaceae bacterium]